MHLLIDMNLAPEWASFLRKDGHQAIHWTRVGDPRASDRALMDWARAHGHIVLTYDLDFSILLSLTGEHGPSLVQVRSQRVMPDDIGEMVVHALREHGPRLAEGAIVTIDELSSRVRVLPLRRG
jgi:predicted nuclease of predicted toxin-antitoxin system